MKRFMTKFAVGALVLGSVALYGVNAASAATPSITVTPSTGLSDGQGVTVTGSGFGPNESLAILECTLGATDAAGCNINAYLLINSSATGTISSTFHVFAGPTGSGTCDMGTTDTSCTLAVANPSNTNEKASHHDDHDSVRHHHHHDHTTGHDDHDDRPDVLWATQAHGPSHDWTRQPPGREGLGLGIHPR
jgi:hypothetical protein